MLKAKIKFNKLLNDDSGVALVLVALCLLVIIGFGAIVADAGLMYRTKRDMVASADACALAVAQEMADAMTVSKGTTPLTEADAQTLAEKYKMRADSVDVSFVTVKLPDKDGVLIDFEAVKADVVRNEKYFFGKAISSKDSGNVRATATAIWEYPTILAGGNILPALTQIDDFNKHLANPNLNMYLHDSTNTDGTALPNSHWALLDIYTGGTSNIKNGLRGGFPLNFSENLEVVEFGDEIGNEDKKIWAENGNKLNYTRDGIGESDKDIEKDGRIVRAEAGLTQMEGIIPITDSIMVSGREEVFIRGFALYEITDCVQNNDGTGLNGGPYYITDENGNFALDRNGEKVPYPIGTTIGHFTSGITDTKVIAGDQDQSHNFGAYDVKLTD